MARNPIQEERIKKYFLDATKEILISEGISSLSVRNVAQKAGYSYTTLYNYFKNLPDLITESIKDFQLDCSNYILEKTKNEDSSKTKLKLIIKAYIDYLVEYPSIFNLFYIAVLSNNESNHSTVLFLEQLCEKDLQMCVKNKIYSKKQVEDLRVKIRFIVPGILFSYLGRNYPNDYNAFLKCTNNQLDSMFNSY